jgi:hypothetical protein
VLAAVNLDAASPRVRRTLALAAAVTAAAGSVAVASHVAARHRHHHRDRAAARGFHVDVARDGDLDHVSLAGRDFDVAELPFARMLGLTGIGSVDGELRVPIVDGRLDYRGTLGMVQMSCRDCVVDVASPLGDVRVGPLAIDRVDARVVAAHGVLSMPAWELRSRDLRLEVALDVQLAASLDDSTLSGCVRFAVRDALFARDPKLAAVLETTGAALDADGMFNIRLAGTLGRPRRLAEVCGGHTAVAPAASDVARHAGDRYEIRRALVDRVLADPIAATASARLVPAVANGHPIGFKLYALRPGSLLDALGFSNGDTVTTVNGYDLTSPDKSLEFYARVRASNEFDVGVIRHGSPRTLHYTIVP